MWSWVFWRLFGYYDVLSNLKIQLWFLAHKITITDWKLQTHLFLLCTLSHRWVVYEKNIVVQHSRFLQFCSQSVWFQYIIYPNQGRWANSEGGKLVKVVLNFFTPWIIGTKRSREHCSSWHLALFTWKYWHVIQFKVSALGIVHPGTWHYLMKVLALGTI